MKAASLIWAGVVAAVSAKPVVIGPVALNQIARLVNSGFSLGERKIGQFSSPSTI